MLRHLQVPIINKHGYANKCCGFQLCHVDGTQNRKQLIDMLPSAQFLTQEFEVTRRIKHKIQAVWFYCYKHFKYK